MTARWGCLILAMVMTALMVAMLVSVRISGMPLSHETTSGDATPDRMGMLDNAREDPRRTAQLVSQWLKEKK